MIVGLTQEELAKLSVAEKFDKAIEIAKKLNYTPATIAVIKLVKEKTLSGRDEFREEDIEDFLRDPRKFSQAGLREYITDI